MARDGNRCIRCGSTENLSLDHIVRYRDDGPDTVENLRTLCIGWGRAARPGYTGIAADYMPEPRLDNVCHIVNPNDGITSLHPQSPLRRLVPYLWALDLDDWGPWAGAVYRHLTGWRRLFDPRSALMTLDFEDASCADQ